MSQSLTRVLILGGGSAGLAAARHFERHLPRDRRVAVTLVSRDNYLLFTPMLAEVAAGQIDAAHIATPTRAFLRRVHVQQGEVVAIDLERRRVQICSPAVQDQMELPYDHLILALGSVASFRHASGAAEHAFPFKHLGDAERIHDRVLDCFDRAAGESDPAQRRALLIFVVAGGGFAGVELAAALADFVHATQRFFPRLAGETAQVLFAHHGARIFGPRLVSPSPLVDEAPTATPSPVTTRRVARTATRARATPRPRLVALPFGLKLPGWPRRDRPTAPALAEA